jgi:hypothetical protein
MITPMFGTVSLLHGPAPARANRIQGCNAKFRVPTAGSPRVIQTAQPAGGIGRGGDPNPIKRCAVLATVNIASRRPGGAYGNVDRCSARLTSWIQAGAEKRLSNRTKKLEKGSRLI